VDTTSDSVITIIVAIFSAFVGASGAALGATWTLREKISLNTSRIQIVESKIGINKEGSLTGNGLIGALVTERSRVDALLLREVRENQRINNRNKRNNNEED